MCVLICCPILLGVQADVVVDYKVQEIWDVLQDDSVDVVYGKASGALILPLRACFDTHVTWPWPQTTSASKAAQTRPCPRSGHLPHVAPRTPSEWQESCIHPSRTFGRTIPCVVPTGQVWRCLLAAARRRGRQAVQPH